LIKKNQIISRSINNNKKLHTEIRAEFEKNKIVKQLLPAAADCDPTEGA
jgi:hypothetical protein